MIVISLPWPPVELNPNKRLHWSKKSRVAKSYRAICRAITQQAARKRYYTFSDDGKIALTIIFRPPDNRARDDDNMLSAFKSGRDGVADALGVNDKRFATRFDVLDSVSGGSVTISVQELGQ